MTTVSSQLKTVQDVNMNIPTTYVHMFESATTVLGERGVSRSDKAIMDVQDLELRGKRHLTLGAGDPRSPTSAPGVRGKTFAGFTFRNITNS